MKAGKKERGKYKIEKEGKRIKKDERIKEKKYERDDEGKY